MNIVNNENLNDCGVYQIRNLKNGKVYIGSTSVNFKQRFEHHYYCLSNNKHKNRYLQNAWNKYGEKNFIFEILLICSKEETLTNEQKYLDLIKYKYNINPLASGTPNLSKEVIKRRSESLKQYWSSKTPEERKEIFGNRIPWNKGKHYKSTDHLKVPKTKTEKLIKSRKQIIENKRNKMLQIMVFDLNDNYLGTWKNALDLEEFSKSENNNLPIKSRFKGDSRMGVPIKHLQYVNIIKACRTNKPYKGLILKYVPSSEETH